MNETFKVSIIIPIYNSEEYLEKTIKNVINQSIGFKNIELILIDDCSKDNSKKIIKKYSEQYSNIKPIFLEENSGHPSFPRNEGLKIVTSPYIIFLDSDDGIYDDYCEVLYNTINSNKVDIVNCNHTSKINNKLYIPQKIETINYNTQIMQEDEKLFLNHTVWGNIYRTSFFRENNIKFLHVLFEDVVFSVYCLLKTKKDVISMDDYPGYIYFIENEKSITHKVDSKTMTDFLKVMELINSLLIKYSSSKTRMDLINKLMEMAFFILPKLNNQSEGIEKLYDFENQIGFEIKPVFLPLKILNKQIINKRFRIALILIKIMGVIYNNITIRSFIFVHYSGVKLLNSS